MFSDGVFAIVITIMVLELKPPQACNPDALMKLHTGIRRKNLLAVTIYAISIPLAWVNVPLSLALIALPAVMYFLPNRRVEQHAVE